MAETFVILKIKQNVYLGVDLSQEKATQIVNYSNSYRQCLMNLQLWLNGYPKPDDKKGPVEALNGISTPLTSLKIESTNINEIESLYLSEINFVSNNRYGKKTMT